MSKSNKLIFPDNVSFNDAAENDFIHLDYSQQLIVFKAIQKVAKNPYPTPKGYGKPLGGTLSGYLKIKLKKEGIRIIYKLSPLESNQMKIIIIGLRSDNEVYEQALYRIKQDKSYPSSDPKP